MSFETTDSSELIDRYKFLVRDYQSLSLDLAKHLERYGKTRKELQIIMEEFQKRKINIEEIDVSLENDQTNKQT